ncbi:MAG TPA: winged helix-turn-helix domain-containing protein [Planctomycetaceae bacterium]|nr:winged helix-turn-helix domain-containing protein [Planctomycetaceae bacterium]
MSQKANVRESTVKPSANNRTSGPRATNRWTFLTNHSHVLVVIHANPDAVLREVALEVGITERAVQRIIQDLVAAGFIERERVGRRNHYRVLVEESLRHPIESHKKIGDLLNLIAGDGVEN